MAKSKVTTVEEAIKTYCFDGMSVLLPGFVNVGVSEVLIEGLIAAGVKDLSVLAAIRCHTTGKVGMLPLDMAVYLADKIEPSRRSYPALEEVRALAENDLLAATIRSLRSTLDYVVQRGGTVHPATRRTLEWLERMQREKEKKEANQPKP